METGRLFVDAVRTRATVLVRMGAGAQFPAHSQAGCTYVMFLPEGDTVAPPHLTAEQVYLLSGDAHVGGSVLQTGDFYGAAAGRLPEITSTDLRKDREPGAAGLPSTGTLSTMLALLVAGFVLLALGPGPATAAPATAAPASAPGEALVFTLPDGWELGWQNEDERVRTQEFVSKPQTVRSWTRLVTVQAHKLIHPLPEFARAIAARVRETCPKAELYRDPQADIDGRPAVRFFLRVPECAATAAESDLILVIQGRDQLFVVLYAWRPVPPTRQEFEQATMLLNSVRVCPTPSGDCTRSAEWEERVKAQYTPQKTLWERSMAAAKAAFNGNRHDEAERLYQEALVEAHRLDAEHETVLTTYDVLATLYRAQRRVELAAEMDRRAALIREKRGQSGLTSPAGSRAP
jgi:hypothetical protein